MATFSIIEGDIGVFSGDSFEEVNKYMDLLPNDFIFPVEAQEMDDGVFELRFYREDGEDIDPALFSDLVKMARGQPRDRNGRWTETGAGGSGGEGVRRSGSTAGTGGSETPKIVYNQYNTKPPSGKDVVSGWKTLKDGMQVHTVMSKDGTKRYSITQVWDNNKKIAQLVMFNPSTADGTKSDATTRRLKSELSKQGFGGIHIVNLYSVRASKPSALKSMSDEAKGMTSIGKYLNPNASVTIAAWGGLGQKSSTGTKHLQKYRELEVIRELQARKIELKAFATTKGGDPVHPIYQKRDPKNPKRMLGYGSLNKLVNWKQPKRT